MTRSRLVLWSIAVVLAVTASISHGQDPKANVMKRKLTSAQKILEGVAVHDFDLIATHAELLIQASQEAGWKVLKTPRYEIYSQDFRRTAEQLIRHAKAKNVDGAALAYVDLTLTCVKCHQHVREEKMTLLSPPSLPR